MKTIVLFLSVYFFIPTSILAQDQPPESVLFVGNSYTYFWNIPKLVHLMAERKNIDIQTRQSTTGGASLGMHWRGDRDLKTKAAINSGNYDAIVLQDQSMMPVLYPDSVMHYGGLFCELAKQKKMQPYVYMTWARASNPLMQEKITKTYKQLARTHGATMVPVGLAWELAKQLRPDIQLHDPDQSHPSIEGAYLTACMFYAVFTGESPVGLPSRIVMRTENEDPLFLVTVHSIDALFMQQVVEKVLEEWENN